MTSTHTTISSIASDPSWNRLVVSRWSDASDSKGNIRDITTETWARFDPADPDVVVARQRLDDMAELSPSLRVPVSGVTPILMSDVCPDIRSGRVGWAMHIGRTVFLIVMHSAMEDDIPGAHLDDGKNAFTELLLMLIRTRHGASMHLAFGTRLGRVIRNRDALVRAMRAYGWQLLLGGQQVQLDDILGRSMEAGVDEVHSRTFHQATGKGELDDLVKNLYPRGPQGLPFTHRFRQVTVSDGHRTWVEKVAKAVEAVPEAAPVLQELATLVAQGASWETVGKRAAKLGVPARHAKDIKSDTGRTLEDLRWPASSVKRLFVINHELFSAGRHRVAWHGKLQGSAAYGEHGTPPNVYTLAQLQAMTARQRRKAEKGYFEVVLNWDVPMLPGPRGEDCPWGVPTSTWDAIAQRLETESKTSRPRGAAAQHRDKKPLVGSPPWVEGDQQAAILGRRPGHYELAYRPSVGGLAWNQARDAAVAVWRSEDWHGQIAAELTRLAEELGDRAAVLSVPARRNQHERDPRAEAQTLLARSEELKAQAEGAARWAIKLESEGSHTKASSVLDAIPGLEEEGR